MQTAPRSIERDNQNALRKYPFADAASCGNGDTVIPCGAIILLASPQKGIVFIIMFIILQQVDGNIIGPKILGSSTGINGFWVMFSIILFGGLFGFWGMLLGVPVFVIIYNGVEAIVNDGLKKKEMPVEDSFYRATVKEVNMAVKPEKPKTEQKKEKKK